MYVTIYLSKPIECKTSRVNRNVNCELWVIMMCQCGFINCDECTILVGDADNEGGYAIQGGKGCNRKSLEPSTQFPVNLRLL